MVIMAGRSQGQAKRAKLKKQAALNANATKPAKKRGKGSGQKSEPYEADMIDVWAVTQGFEIPAEKQKDIAKGISEIVLSPKRSPRDRVRAMVALSGAHFRQLELKQKQTDLEERLMRGYAPEASANVNVQVINQQQVNVDAKPALLPVDDLTDPRVNEAYDQLARELSRYAEGPRSGEGSAVLSGDAGDTGTVEVCPPSGSDSPKHSQNGFHPK